MPNIFRTFAAMECAVIPIEKHNIQHTYFIVAPPPPPPLPSHQIHIRRSQRKLEIFVYFFDYSLDSIQHWQIKRFVALEEFHKARHAEHP